MKNPVLFMGLFLVAFGLYANERIHSRANQLTSSKEAPEAVAKIAIERDLVDPPSHGAESKLQTLFQAFLADPLFSGKTDGIRLVREPKAIMIQFFGDDVFAEGNPVMRESWYSALDRIAEKLKPEEFKRGLRVEIRGFADESSLKEQRPTDFEKSDFSFSFTRAEWLARYLERKWRVSLQENFTLTGMGARPYGKKVEFWFSY